MVSVAGAALERRFGQASPVRPGSKSRAKAPWGSLGTWETQTASLGQNAGKDGPAEQHPGLGAVGWPASESERPSQPGVRPWQCDEQSEGLSAVGVLMASSVPQTKPANRDRRGSRGVGKGVIQERNRRKET